MSKIHLPNNMEMQVAQMEQAAQMQADMKFQIRMLRLNLAGSIMSRLIGVTSNQEDMEQMADKSTMAADILLAKHNFVRIQFNQPAQKGEQDA